MSGTREGSRRMHGLLGLGFRQVRIIWSFNFGLGLGVSHAIAARRLSLNTAPTLNPKTLKP